MFLEWPSLLRFHLSGQEASMRHFLTSLINARSRAIGAISSGQLVASFLGIVLQAVLAHRYGVGMITDSYFMARSIGEILGKLFFWSQFQEVFLPIFWKLYSEDHEKAWRFTSSIFIVVFLSACLLFLLIFSFGEFVTRAFAPGFSIEAMGLTKNLLSIWIVTVMFLLALGIPTSIAQAFNNFSIPSFLDSIKPLIAISIFLTLNDVWGIYALALGYLVGTITNFGLLLWTIRRYGFRWYFQIDWEHLRLFFKNLRPFIFSNAAVLGSGFVYKVSVSLLPSGALSAIMYASRIYNFLAAITFSAINTFAFPELTRIAKNGMVRFKKLLTQNLKWSLAACTIAAIPLIIFGNQIVSVIYQKGRFTSEEVKVVSAALLLYAIALYPNSTYSLLRKAFLSLREVSFVVKMAIITEILQAALFYPFSVIWGYQGLIAVGIIATVVLTFFYAMHLRQLRESSVHD